MSAGTSSSGALGTLVRVSVVAGERTADIGAPGAIPVAELIPGLARTLGLLDPSTVHGGFRLVRSDGAGLDSDRSLQAQGVQDGAVLTLTSGADAPEVKVYDDVVEAVADAVEGHHAPWTPQDSALTAVFASVAFLLAGAALLLGAERTSMFPPVIAGVGSLLVVGAAAVVARVGKHGTGAPALVIAASVLGLVAGLTATSGPVEWGWPTALGGLGVLVIALLGLVALPSGQEVCLAPGALGVALAASGGAIATSGTSAGVVLAVVVALVVTAGNGIPWLALASTPLRVVSARTDSEILAEPPVVDPVRVREQYARGHRLQIALRAAVAAFTLAAAPVVVSTGIAGTLLTVAAFIGMLLGVRQTYSRQDVMVVMGSGIVGLTLTGVLAAAAHPTWRPTLAVVAGTVAAVIIAVSLIAPRRRVGLERMADTIELTSLALLLPLGAAAAGLV